MVQLLRRRRLSTAAWLAHELEVSERTIYRDVKDLVSSGVPITGEAGVGYALERGFELPPLTFTREELVALALGTRVVLAWGDPDLARSAKTALERIRAVVPDTLRAVPEETTLSAPTFHVRTEQRRGLRELRAAIGQKRKVRLEYVRKDGRADTRVIRPLGLSFWGHAWSVTAFCELREDFRHFRLDRIAALDVLEDVFEDEPGRTLGDVLRRIEREV
uniref:helix-turn-helix transcriptional regulator n=1 Tax=Sandaracinus sp. TaxID=2024858 RepID=UPI001FD24463|nr:YafY family protein [Sandaracinus sp.]